ncbi:hypothetical protein OH77DRAFT_976810 [Trametes cingulata]|nr:hypothetical protein OH77DRAFT_976810 [Trametes cingulata]
MLRTPLHTLSRKTSCLGDIGDLASPEGGGGTSQAVCAREPTCLQRHCPPRALRRTAGGGRQAVRSSWISQRPRSRLPQDSDDEQATRRHVARSGHVPSSRLVLTPPTRERSSSTRPRSLLPARGRPLLRALQEFESSLAGLPNRSCRLRLTGRWFASGDHYAGGHIVARRYY